MIKNTEKSIEKDQALLVAIKHHLPKLDELKEALHREYENGIYRFYHQSLKVYQLQYSTLEALALIQQIATDTDNELNSEFMLILMQGTGIEFDIAHNQAWSSHTRTIVEAFLHAHYFINMLTNFGHQLDIAPQWLPNGWAAILELFNQR